jgi:hypothetical protein
MTSATFSEVQALLDGLDFPAEKDHIIAHAEAQGAGSDSPAVRTLGALPPGVYRDLSEIRDAVEKAN